MSAILSMNRWAWPGGSGGGSESSTAPLGIPGSTAEETKVWSFVGFFGMKLFFSFLEEPTQTHTKKQWLFWQNAFVVTIPRLDLSEVSILRSLQSWQFVNDLMGCRWHIKHQLTGKSSRTPGVCGCQPATGRLVWQAAGSQQGGRNSETNGDIFLKALRKDHATSWTSETTGFWCLTWWNPAGHGHPGHRAGATWP